MLKFLGQLFCFHKPILKTDKDGRFYTECRKCGKETGGIQTGGFVYSHLEN